MSDMSDGQNATEAAESMVSPTAATDGDAAVTDDAAQVADPSEVGPAQQTGSNGVEQPQPQAMMPPPTRMPPPSRMPPPKFKAPSPSAARPAAADDADAAARAKARTAAVAAAAAAAKSSLPAQRERAVAEAAARAYAAHHVAAPGPEAEGQVAADTTGSTATGAADAAVSAQTDDQQQEAQQAQPAARTPAVYEPPAWSGIPDGVGYSLEQIKSGSSLGVRDVAEQAFYTFGRTPNNDIVLEHPSSSRLHAVLQFNGETRMAYLYDANSAHGTFVNRRRIKSGVHVPIRVGDMIKFGQSTRDWLLGGPAELMPEEGPSKAQRLEARLLKSKAARRRKEEELAAAQMEVALGRGEGASWGFGEDAVVDEDEDGAGDVDWRAFSQTRGLTDKQENLATKVRKKENTIRNLTTECERIRAKQALDELTAGQASTLARNERSIDLLKEEMEDLEETLTDSVRDSILGRKKASAEVAAAKKAAAERRRRQREEDQDAGSSDEDEFYDRTRTGGAAAAVAPAAGPARKKAKVDAALDAGTLYTQAEALTKEAAELEAAIATEVQLRASNHSDSAAAAAAETSMTANGSADGDSAAAPDRQAADGAAAAAMDTTDALDAFMHDMAKQADADKVVSLRKQLADVQRQLAGKQKLLKVADPDGYFAPGSAAAKAASQRAAQQAALEAERAAAKEQQRLARLAQKQKEAELAAAANVEETEEADDQAAAAAAPSAVADASEQQPQPSSRGALPAGLTIRKRPTADTANGTAPSTAQGLSAATPADHSGGSAAAAAASAPAAVQPAASAPASSARHEPPAVPPSGLEVRPKKRQRAEAGIAPAAAPDSGDTALGLAGREASASGDSGPRLLSRAELVAQQQQQRQAAGIAADLDALARARQGAGAQAEEMETAWQPPQEQKGDGRTALNDKFGY